MAPRKRQALLIKKLFLHALGRAPTADDTVAMERLLRSLPKDGPITFEHLILGIVRLDAFRQRSTAAAPRRGA